MAPILLLVQWPPAQCSIKQSVSLLEWKLYLSLIVQALLYFIQLMDSIVRKKFVFVYVHTLTPKEHQPDTAFLKDICNILDHRSVTIIHPLDLYLFATEYRYNYQYINMNVHVSIIHRQHLLPFPDTKITFVPSI